MSATRRPTRPQPTMITRGTPGSASGTCGAGSTWCASKCPTRASNGVTVKPMAVTISQNCAVVGWISCAVVAVLSKYLLRTRQAHVHQAALFVDIFGIDRLAMRKNSLFQPDEKHMLELESLRRVQRR